MKMLRKLGVTMLVVVLGLVAVPAMATATVSGVEAMSVTTSASEGTITFTGGIVTPGCTEVGQALCGKYRAVTESVGQWQDVEAIAYMTTNAADNEVGCGALPVAFETRNYL